MALATADAAENSGASGEHVRDGGEHSSGGDPIGASASDTDDGAPHGAAPPASSSHAHARRPVAFQSAHALRFGLEVVARDASASPPCVTAVLCLFCKHFGREPKAGAKRRATTNFKYFKGVFRTDQYLQHHRLQHPAKWAEYDAASLREKQSFFPRYLMTDNGGDDNPAEAAATTSKPRTPKKQRRNVTVETGDELNGANPPHEAVAVLPTRADDLTIQFEIPQAVVALVLGDTQWEPQSLPRCELVQAEDASDSSLHHHGRDQWMVRGGVASKSSESERQVYRGVLPDRRSFDMAVDLLATGLSPSQTVRALRAMANYVTSGAVLASVWTDLVDDYAQVATLSSLTLLASLMSSSWAFSIGFHGRESGGHGSQVIDVRVRFLASSTLHDFHLCCLGADETHAKLLRVMSVLCPDWADRLMGISVAGDVLASTALSRAIRWLQDSVALMRGTLYATWDGHALVKRAFLELFQQLQGGAFATTFRRFKAYVKSQARLIQEIGHEPQPPQKSDREQDGMVMEIIATAHWFTAKRVRIRKFVEEECELSMTSRPSEAWWLCLAIFDWIATPTETAMHTIAVQLARLAPSEQLTLLQELDSEIASAFRVTDHVNTGTGAISNSVEYLSSHGAFAATKTGVLEFIVELGSFVNSLLTSFRHEELDVTLESLGTSIASFVETLRQGIIHGHGYLKLMESDAADGVDRMARPPPPVLPQDFVKLNGKEFSTQLAKHRQQLRTRFSEEELDMMEQEHLALKRAIREKEFRAWATSTNDAAQVDRLEQFDSTWAKTTGRFRLLHAFAGGLASALPRGHGDAAALRGPQATTDTLDMEAEAPRHAAQFHDLQRLWRLQPFV
jgi:hypothetical protein